MNDKYELDYLRSHDNGHHEIIAILTGHEIEDIVAASSENQIWYPKMYIAAFRKLGFNCDDRFVKFNPDTDKPCMMRFKRNDIKESYWHAFAYYDHKVYLGAGEWYKFDLFIEANPHFRITSMLRVWI